MREVFISFASADRAIADRLVRNLEDRGLSCWIAHRDIKGGENYQAQIPAAVEACTVMLVLYSRNAAKSPEIPKEMVLARTLKKRLIPLRIEDHKPEGAFLYEFVTSQYLDLFGDFDAVADVLAHQLDEHCSKAGEVAARTRKAAGRRKTLSWVLRGSLVAGALVCAAAAWKLAPALHSMQAPRGAPGTDSLALAAPALPPEDNAPAGRAAASGPAAGPASGPEFEPASGPASGPGPLRQRIAMALMHPPQAGLLAPPPPAVPAPMLAPAPAPAPATEPSALVQRASDFAVNYYAMMGAPPSQSVAYLSAAVADQVRFYGKPMSRARLIEIQKAYAERWPTRSLAVRTGSLQVNCAAAMQACQVSGICDYDLRSDARRALSTGSERFTLGVSVGSNRLVSITSTPLERHTGTLAESSTRVQ